MLEAETEAGDYWKKCGEDASAHSVKGIVIMVRFASNYFVFVAILAAFFLP